MYKAIIVDDEDLFRKTLMNKIDWDAFKLTLAGEAANGREAMALIDGVRPDIIICDVKMPVMDGLELLKSLPANSRIRFIILSGFSEFEFIRTAVKYGAFDYILKPVQAEELTGVLLRAAEDIENERRRERTDLDISLDIRNHLGKYESLFIHFVEGRDMENINRYIDTVFAELEPYPAPQLNRNSLREFIYLINRICDTFKVNRLTVLRGYTEEDPGSYSRTEEVIDRVKQLFNAVVDDLIYQKNMDRKKIVYDVISDIEKNYKDKISLELISRKYYINPSYFSQLFKSVTNDTFSNYVIRFRMQKAKELMRIPNLKIYQIAEMVGYEDEKHFSQLFKKHVGMAPTAYQKVAVR